MSGSRSNSRQQSSNSNQSTSIGIGGANEGLVVNGSGNTFTDLGAIEGSFSVVSESLDGIGQSTENALMYGAGVTTTALDGMTTATENALIYGAGSQEAAYDFLDTAMSDMNQGQSDVFEWAAGTQQETNSTALNFLDFADGETDDTLMFAGGLVKEVLGANDQNQLRAYQDIEDSRSSLDSMLEWSGGFIGSILDSSENNQQQIRDANTASISALNSAHSQQITGMQQSYDSSMQFAAGAFTKGIDTVTGMAKETQIQANNVLDGIATFTQSSVSQMGDLLNGGLEAVKTAGQSESADLNDKLMKGFGIGAVVIVGLGLYFGSKK